MKGYPIKNGFFENWVCPCTQTTQIPQKIQTLFEDVCCKLVQLGHDPADPASIRLAHSAATSKNQHSITHASSFMSERHYCI